MVFQFERLLNSKAVRSEVKFCPGKNQEIYTFIWLCSNCSTWEINMSLSFVFGTIAQIRHLYFESEKIEDQNGKAKSPLQIIFVLFFQILQRLKFKSIGVNCFFPVCSPFCVHVTNLFGTPRTSITTVSSDIVKNRIYMFLRQVQVSTKNTDFREISKIRIRG